MAVAVPAAVSLASLSEQVRQSAQKGSPHMDLWARMRGWEQVFGALAPALAQHPGLPVAALVPRLLNHSRPAWAELGVGLVLDRATAPPLIADQLDRWLLPKIEPVE